VLPAFTSRLPASIGSELRWVRADFLEQIPTVADGIDHEQESDGHHPAEGAIVVLVPKGPGNPERDPICGQRRREAPQSRQATPMRIRLVCPDASDIQE